MSDNTPIQWADSTVNPVMGCNGCELWSPKRKTCYAGKQHEWRGASHKGFADVFAQPTLFPGRIAEAARWTDLTGTERPDKPWLNGLPRLIFISDMGEALSEKEAVHADGKPVPGGAVPFEFLKQEIIDNVLSPKGQRHRWLWLTKQPGRLAKFATWLREKHGLGIPPNLWIGTSVTSKATVARVKKLAKIGDEDTNRFVSVEPLWGEVSLAEHLSHVSWVIVGGESKQESPAKEFRCEWARTLMADCGKGEVTFFVKQLGANATDGGKQLALKHSHGGDWIEWPEDLRIRRVPGTETIIESRPTVRLFTRLSEMSPQEVVWGWKNRIAFGEISIVDGDPAQNKSSVALDLAARFSTGRPMPDGSEGVLGGVLMLLAEDSIRKTVLRRLDAAGADTNRIAVMNGDVTLPDNLEQIRAAVVQLAGKLIVIDPFMAYLTVDGNKEQRVRKATGPLKRLAEEADVAIVLVRHLNKGGGRNPLYRGLGSIGISAAVRSAFLVAESPDDRNMRVLCQTKNNLGPIAESLLFEPVSNGDGVVRIEWRGPCKYSAEDLLSPRRNGEGKLGEAESLLLEKLKDGPVKLKVIKDAAAEKVISFRTLERAKTELGIQSKRRGFSEDGAWFWELPIDDENTE